MKIQIKTLKSKKYELEVKADETVEEVKEKIQKELKLGDASMMSLIHHGKILKNQQTATQVGFKENDFVVLMLKKKKKKVRQKEKVSENTPGTASTEQSSETAAVSTEDRATSTSTSQENLSSTPVTNAFVMGSQLNEAVRNLTAMGFPEAEVRLAMRAAYNNPERAAEYLLTGIPQNLASGALGQQFLANNQLEAQTLGVNQPAVPNPSANASANPQQGEMQRLMRQNPGNMVTMLRNLMRTQPELFQGIGANGNINPAAIENLLRDPNFMRMMMQAMGGRASGAEPAGARTGVMGQQGAQPPIGNPSVLHMTEAESASVDRLKLLGFSRQQAIEAFLVCNKNEQMAANYLFENVNDFSAAPVSAPPTEQPVPAHQPVKSVPTVTPTVIPVAAGEQKPAEQGSNADTGATQPNEGVNQNAMTRNNATVSQASQTEEVDVNQGPVNQISDVAERTERNEAKNNNNADGAADAKDEEMGEPNK